MTTTGDFNFIENKSVEVSFPDRMDGGFGPGLIAAIAGIGLVLLFALTCGIIRMCKKEETDRGPGYSVAISNRLFKEIGTDGKEILPCLNCRLIEMGEMACYQERCPQCGQIPPGKKQLYESSAVPSGPSSAHRQQHFASAKQQQQQQHGQRSHMGQQTKHTQDSIV